MPFSYKMQHDYLGSGRRPGGFRFELEIPTPGYTIEVDLWDGPSINDDSIIQIIWGDDVTEIFTGINVFNLPSHTYASAGTYVVSYTVLDEQNYAYNINSLTPSTEVTAIRAWGDMLYEEIRPRYDDGSGAFHDCSSIVDLPVFAPGSSFSFALFPSDKMPQNMAAWDVSPVTNINFAFRGPGVGTDFNQDISGWDVSSVTTMDSTFSRCNVFNQDLSSWDTANVTFMGGCFSQAPQFNANISSWNTSSVTNTSAMFFDADAFNQPIGNWDVSSVTSMDSMFQATANFNADISGWDTGNVTTMINMFSSASSFNQDISGWKVGKVTDFGASTFFRATAFDQDLSAWKITALTGSIGFSLSGLSNTNYDSMLASWGAKSVKSGVTLYATDKQVTTTAGATGRAQLISKGWTIFDLDT